MGLWIVRTAVTGEFTQRCVALPPFSQCVSNFVEIRGMVKEVRMHLER